MLIPQVLASTGGSCRGRLQGRALGKDVARVEVPGADSRASFNHLVGAQSTLADTSRLRT